MSGIPIVEVLVVGAGPAGFSVAAECAFHGLSPVLVLEKGTTHNQTVLQYYPDEKRVDAAYKGQEAVCAGVLCFRDTTKANFLAIVDQMLERYAFRMEYNATVDSIKKIAGLFHVSTTDGREFRSRFVVISIGRMGKPNRPDYFNDIPPGARKRVQFDVRNLDAAGKEVLVVGGGNSAIEFALSLAQKAKVTVSYRQSAFTRLNPMNLELLEKDEASGRIRVLRNSHVAKVDEEAGQPRVQFKDGETKTYDYVIYGIGGSSPAAFLQSAGLEIDDKGNPRLNEWNESTVAGLYVAGELSVPPGKGSIIVSFNSGKRVVESIMIALGRERKPEQVHLVS